MIRQEKTGYTYKSSILNHFLLETVNLSMLASDMNITHPWSLFGCKVCQLCYKTGNVTEKKDKGWIDYCLNRTVINVS